MCLFTTLLIIIIITVVDVVVGIVRYIRVITFRHIMTIMNLRKWTVKESRRQTSCETLDNNYA